jgi:hypothetical protein
MMNQTLATHLDRLTRAHTIEAPTVEVVNQQVRTSMSVPFQRHMLGEVIEAPAVETVNQQVRTSMSVPFQRHMLGQDGAMVEAPAVDTVNQQVRTSMSVPYAPHMKGTGAAPAIDTVNQQVRTSMSVPFSPHMRGGDADTPAIDTVNQQVRTSMSVPYATYMRDGVTKGSPAVGVVDQHVRTSMSVPFNPYMLGAHAEELLKRRIMISPVLAVWRYQVKSNEAFGAWLATREILMSEGRLAGDAEIRGVRYGGTYRVGADRSGLGGTYKTVWGYTSESSMHAMQKLCSDSSVSATIVQLELIDFVKGLKKFIAEAGDQHFAEEILISAAAG